MSKSKRGSKENPVKLNGEENIIQDEREIVIKSCIIKDDHPAYSFERLINPGKGDVENVKGAALIHADMHKAFKKLHVHLAHIDDAFKNGNVEIESILKMHNHELTGLYSVTGFKIKGQTDDEKVSLIGKKYLSVGGYADIETPDVLMSDFSAYKWWNELNAAIDKCRREVELYRFEGKCTPTEDDEPQENKNQLGLDLKEAAGVTAEFETGKV